jgi:large subunit ribosomal protein L32
MTEGTEMAVPKRRTSLSKKKMRVRSHKKSYTQTQNCAQCGAPSQPHRICPSCGYYRGRQVVTVATEE